MNGQAAAPAAVPATPAAPMPPTQAGSSPVKPAQPTGQDPSNTDPKAPAEKPPSAPPKKFKVKVNGKEREFTEDELLQRASLAEAAQERFNEAAKLRRQAEQVIGKLRDPKQVMTVLQDPALGLSKDAIRAQFEEWYAKEFIETEKLTPEQKKIREQQAELEKYKQRDKETEEQKLKAQQEAMTAQAREQVQTQIIEALETGGLPKTNFTIRRLAYWMQRNHANGFDAPVSLVVSQVKSEMETTLRDLVQASDGEVLVKLLGDGVIQKLRKYDLEQLRKLRDGGAPVEREVPISVDERGDDRPPTQADVQARLREMQKTGRY